MASLVRNDEVLTELQIAESFGSRLLGLMGKKQFNGVLIIRPANSVHTLFMRFPIDVAFLDREMRVIAIAIMKPWRMGLPRRKARSILEAPQGTFAKWNLQVGDAVEIQP